MENTPELTTERLVLRRFRKGDEKALLEILGDEEVNRFLPMFPLLSLEEAKAFLKERYLDTYKARQGYRYAICLKGEETPVGYLNLAGDESRDLGYGLRREFWNQGIVTEAGKALLERLEKDGVPYITATHDIQNPASGAVMEKLGLQYRYSYQEQWQPKDKLVTFRMYQKNFTMAEDWVYREYWERYPVHFVEMRGEGIDMERIGRGSLSGSF